MPWSMPYSCRRSSRSSLDAVASTVAPARLRELDRGEADAAGARLDEHGLACLQVTELEQAVVGGAELDRDAGGLLE